MKIVPSIVGLSVAIGLAVTVQAVDPANCVIANGNINADTRVDLTDAIYLLSYLYQGGRAPKPQFVADNECLVSLREELAAAKSELADTKIALSNAQTSLDAREADLAALRTTLDTCNGVLNEQKAQLTDCQAAKADLQNAIAGKET